MSPVRRVGKPSPPPSLVLSSHFFSAYPFFIINIALYLLLCRCFLHSRFARWLSKKRRQSSKSIPCEFFALLQVVRFIYKKYCSHRFNGTNISNAITLNVFTV